MNVGFTTGYANYYNSGNISYQDEINAPENTGGIGSLTTVKSEKGKSLSFGGCETCRKRKYVDGSDEADVSFKTPGHIDPGSSAMVVAGHEREHVANAIQKSKSEGAKLVSASVRLQTSVCPECGRRYVSGGVTQTTIKYSNSDPYSEAAQNEIDNLLKGNNVDMKV